MLKSLSVLLCCLCLTACVFSSGEQVDKPQEQLLVEKITTDAAENKDIRQINIHFNRDIALLGSVPTAQQVQAVKLSHSLNQQCQWRFIQLNILSCDLKTSLKYMTHYQVSIDDSFSALGKTLAEPASLTLSTPVPEMELQVERREKDFPISFMILGHKLLQVESHELQEVIKVVSPTNKRYSIKIERRKNDRYYEWIASIEQFPELPEHGKYKIVLQEGFRASEHQYALSKDVIIESFRYSDRTEFYGFVCPEEGYPYDYREIEIDENGILPCSPERIGLAFSPVVFDQLSGRSEYRSLDWIKGPKAISDYRRTHFEENIYRFHLTGDSDYLLNLSKLTINGQPQSHLPNIEFKTRPATPYWYLAKQQNSVVEADVNVAPVLLRRNVNPLKQRITSINSKDELQRFLNGELTAIVEDMIETDEVKRDKAPQSIEFQKYLSSNSGLVHIEFSGRSLAHFLRHDFEDRTESNVFNSASHNIAIWNGLELVVQTIDWDANPIRNAEISLVCEGLASPRTIGHTNQNGVLMLNQTEWQSHYQLSLNRNSECWLWSDNSGQTSAIKLAAPSLRLKHKVKAQAWSTQPLYKLGDKVDIGFIARYRSEKGLVPLTSLDNYQLLLSKPNGKKIPLSFGELSNMGFAATSLELEGDYSQGFYDIVLKDASGLQQDIGSFIVTEFTPPEFDLKVNMPGVALKGEPLSIDVTHRRMNGTALKQAKANVHFELSRKWREPNSWPSDYDYIGYGAFKNNKNGKEKGGQYNIELDDDGGTSIKLERFESTVPYAKLRINTEVIAQDGSSLKDIRDISYFSRTHYIGTRYDKKQQKLELIGIDYQGKKLTDIPVVVSVYRDPVERGEPPILVKTCRLSGLPASCPIEQEHETLDVVIESGHEQYRWKRNVYSNTPRKPRPSELKSAIKLSVKNEGSIVSGQPIKVILNSPYSGIVNLILHTGSVKKVWQQSVGEGINTIDLVADDTWIPSAKLYASVPVPRKTASQVIIGQLERLAKTDELESYHLSQLGAQRLLTDDVTITVKSAITTPKTRLTIDSQAVEAGQRINITVEADQPSESQLWLLNDALLSYFPYAMNDYDFKSKVFKGLRYEYPMSKSDLSDELAITSLIAGIRDSNIESPMLAGMSGMLSDGKTSSKTRFKPKPPLSNSFASLKAKDKDQFVQSKMLQRLELKAGEPQTISVQLPQLVGRWKVVALTATKLTSSLATLDITTKRPVEYFVDAPTDVYQMDLSQLAVTAINQQEKQIEDTLSLWDGDVLIGEKKLRLAAEEQRRVVFDMPTLATGDHLLRVTSELDSDYVNYHQVSVAPPIYQQRQQWLVKPSQSQQIIKPSAAIEGSISLNYQSLANQAIDWRALASYNQSYPYQCWEQTISRALSYQSNPLASEAWPKGKEILRNEIASRKLSRGNISYFEGMKSDKFLLAYTYLVNAWMKDGLSTKLPAVDSYGGLKDSFDVRYETPNKLERSMALLALATRGDITLDDALKQRQDIGFSGPFANVLQALALKTLGADKALYLDNLSAANDNTYLDESTNTYNDTAQQCFAALVYEQGSVEREQLTSRVIAKQQQLGHFGSTFANGVCSYLLKDQGVKENAQPKSLKFTQAGNQLQYQLPEQQAHWLTMEYQLPLTEVTAQNAGLDLKRQRFVRVDGKWQLINSNTDLRVGDLVKTTLSIGSAIPRTHLAITDDVAGGLEVISPWLQNVFYKDSSSREWKSNNHIDIQDGRVTWYLLDLQDKDSYSYYSRVRHVGEFQTGPAIAEAMYRTDVKSRTSSSRVVINE